MALTDRDRAILDLERSWWTESQPKSQGIRALGVSPARYYQVLAALIDAPEAETYDPLVVRRLRRQRTLRRRERFEGRPAGGRRSR